MLDGIMKFMNAYPTLHLFFSLWISFYHEIDWQIEEIVPIGIVLIDLLQKLGLCVFVRDVLYHQCGSPILLHIWVNLIHNLIEDRACRNPFMGQLVYEVFGPIDVDETIEMESVGPKELRVVNRSYWGSPTGIEIHNIVNAHCWGHNVIY